MPKTKVEVYDKDQLIYPFIESDHITFSNGMKITEMLDQSISMPKVTHEDSSFKVGVGDQDVSSAIVDSSVADMTIKGQTYQNILPDPTLRNEMQGKSIQRLNEGYDNIEVVDGVSKSAILKGQTLVNCIKVISYMTTAWPAIKLENVLIQPNKKYIAILKHLPVDCQWAITNIGESQSVHVQYNKAMYSIFTSSSTTTANLLLHINKVVETDLTLEELQKVQPMVIEYQEGMENWDIPYFTGMQSVKMPVLTTTGKNLFDGELEIGNISGTNGTNQTTDKMVRTTYIKVSPNVNFTVSIDGDYLIEKISEVDKNKSFVRNAPINTQTKTITLTGQTHFLRCVIRKTDSSTITVDEVKNSNLQLEISDRKTTYEPYKSNILSTPEDLELRGIGDVKDELNVMTGELTQKFAMWRITAEGSHWSRNVDFIPADGYSGFNFKISSEFTNEFLPKLGGLRISCTPFGNWAGHGSANEGIDFHPNGNGKFVIESSKVPVGDLEALRAWLRDNPVYICYELATPTIKTVDLSDNHVYSYKDTTHYSFETKDNSLIPTLSLDVPTKLNALVARQKDTIQELTQENESLKAAQQILLNSQLSFYESLVSTIPALAPTEGQVNIPDFIQDLYRLKNNQK